MLISSYKWIVRSTHSGVSIPRRCTECGLWVAKLDNHLRSYHAIKKDEIAVLKEASKRLVSFLISQPMLFPVSKVYLLCNDVYY